jgi:oligopeptide transport system substrate-binding protein
METRRLVLTLTGIAVALVVVLGGLSIALLAGGGGDENGDTTSDGSPTPGVDLPDRVKGELRLFGPDPITLDPACAADAGSAEYIVEIFSGLVSFDQDLNIIPDIAESIDVSDDGLVYTFHLRKTVAFHDGSRRVTAGDFKFSMERALNPDTLSTVGEVYLDDIVGAGEFVLGQAEEVTGINAVNDDTLEITIDAPKAYFLSKLTYPTAFVVDRREVGDSTCFEGQDWTQNPNGTGPFKLSELAFGERIELVPNPDFYLDPKPSLSKVTYVISGGSPLVMYENDEIDATGIGINDIERIRDPSEALNAEFHESESLDTFYIGFNVEEPPFDDPKVRQALAMAIDKDLIASSLLVDLVIPARGILPPGMPGYNDDLEGLPYDPGKASDLLEEAGGPDVLNDVTLLASGRGASPGPVLEAIVALWEESLGVVIPIEQEEFGVFQRDIKQGTYQMASLGWIADYPDPQDFLDILFHSKSPNNDTHYSNAEVDDLLERARTEPTRDERLRLYQQAEEIVVGEAPWIPLSHGKNSYLVKPDVKGYFVPQFVIPNLRYVSIER